MQRRGTASMSVLITFIVSLVVIIGGAVAVYLALSASRSSILEAEMQRLATEQRMVSLEMEAARARAIADDPDAIHSTLQQELNVTQRVAADRNRRSVPPQPLVSFAGSDSSVEEHRFERIRTSEAWRELWVAHRGENIERDVSDRVVIPEINFDEVEVIAVFVGAVQNIRGVDVHQVSVGPNDLLRIDLEYQSFGTFSADPSGGAVTTQPYGIFVIPATDQPISIRRVQRATKSGPITARIDIVTLNGE
ncbi:MAG: hypothetical protein ACOC0P_01455 [Planctomycetota bacterium]